MKEFGGELKSIFENTLQLFRGVVHCSNDFQSNDHNIVSQTSLSLTERVE